MNDDYADAVNYLNDLVSAATSAAQRKGLSNKEIVEELRRIATEIEDDENEHDGHR